MLKNNKGFSFIEIIIAASIIFMVITTTVPLVSIIQQERNNLEMRRIVSAYLHDELQEYLWVNKNLPKSYEKSVNKKTALFNFALEGNLVEGCVTWSNEKDAKEDVCLYGIRKE